MRWCMYTASLLLARPSPTATAASVAPSTALGFPELVHLGHPLLELDILALLVAVSLVLQQRESACQSIRIQCWCCRPVSCSLAGRLGCHSYLTLPRQVVCLVPTPVEGDQKVGAAVSVCHGELRIAHLLAGRSCCRPSALAALSIAVFLGAIRRGVSDVSSSAILYCN